jgi:hypothetical protein
MRKRVIWGIVLVASHLLFFAGGSALARHTALGDFIRQTERADAQVTLGHYTVYRDIAVEISSRRYDRAKCNAELLASSMLDDVKGCLGNVTCRGAVEENVRKVAPEVLGQAPVAFGYIALKGGGRSCN